MISSYAVYLAEHGGMATCGEHLGVMVGTDPYGCPRGWVFVPLGATAEIVQEALNLAKRGRSAWPPKD